MASPTLRLAKSPPPDDRWSKLPVDLMQLVFDRLSFSDFERAKSVCTTWYSGSRRSKPSNKIPWMVLFEEEKSYCLLFNPEEDEAKLYKTQHLGDNLGNGYCVATYGSWLLMRFLLGPDDRPIYIVNILTGERIDLPRTDSLVESPILWIDEKTKDYLVVIDTGSDGILYCKKGDHSWTQISQLFSGLQEDMMFKDDMLYCLTREQLCVFDFSAESPLLVSRVKVGEKPVPSRRSGNLLIRMPDVPWEFQTVRERHNVVVNLRGDVLLVKSINPSMSKTWNFQIFKIINDSSKEEVFSLGDEAIFLDLGITVLAKDQPGLTSNSIYFTDDDLGWYETEIFAFNLDTKNVEQLPTHVSTALETSRARWFLPTF